MKNDFRSRYQKGVGSRGMPVGQFGGNSSLDDILTDTYDDIDDTVCVVSPLFRFIAFLIDLYIIAFIIFIISISIESVSPESIYSIDTVKKVFDGIASEDEPEFSKTMAYGAWSGLFLIIALIYYSFLEGSSLRASVGKFLMGMSVYGKSGEDCSLLRIILRNVFKIFSIATLGIGFLIAIFGSKRCLHDILSKTQVAPVPDLSSVRRVLRFLGMSFTLGTVLISCLFIGLAFMKSSDPQQEQEVKVEEVVATPSPTPTPIPRGKYGSIKIGDSDIQINGVFLRNKPSEEEEDVSGSIFDTATSVQNNIVVEMVFFEETLTADETKKLQMLYDILNESESVLGKRAIARLEIAYDKDLVLCQMSNTQYASLFINKALLPDKKEYVVQLVKGYRQSNRTLTFSTSCSELSYGKDLSLRAAGQHLEKNLNWSINARTTYLRYKLLGSSSYLNSVAAVAVFNESSNIMEVGFFNRMLSQNELSAIRSSKSIKASRLSISPNAVATVRLTTPDLRKVKQSALSLLKRNKLLALSANNVRSGYSVLFRRDGKVVSFLGDSNELLVKYDSPQVPSTFGGMLEDGRPVFGRFSGIKQIKMKEGIYKFNWSISYNTKLIYVK